MAPVRWTHASRLQLVGYGRTSGVRLLRVITSYLALALHPPNHVDGRVVHSLIDAGDHRTRALQPGISGVAFSQVVAEPATRFVH